MNTCRLCYHPEGRNGHYKLIKYSVRHYAHADCGLKARGVAFLANLTDWQCYAEFPYKAARDHSKAAEAELLRRCALHEATEKERNQA